MDTDGNGSAVVHAILAGNLGLTIGSDPIQNVGLADLSQAGAQRGGQVVGKGHHRLSLVGGITEHDTLVTGTGVLNLSGIDRLSNIGRLLFDGNNDVHGSVVKTLGDIVVSDFLASIANDLLVVNGSRGGNLTEDHNHASLGASLASYTRERILLDASIEDSIRNLVAEFVYLWIEKSTHI